MILLKRCFACVCILVLLCSFSACGDKSRVVFTTGFGKEDVFRIDDIRCTRGEIMVYLYTTQNRYEEVYGPEVWNVSKGDITLENNVKDTVLEKTARIKTMYLLAQNRDLKLEESEQTLAERAAEEYFNGLSEEERCKNRKEVLSIKKDDFKEFASWFREAMSSYNITVIGNTNKINENKDMFKTIRPLKK